MSDDQISAREFGALVEKVNHLPTYDAVGAVRSEALTAITEGMHRLESLLKEHKDETQGFNKTEIKRSVRDEAETQWANVYEHIDSRLENMKPKRDWPMVGALLLLALMYGAEKVLWPVLKLSGFPLP